MMQGPDEGATYIDQQVRIETAEMELELTGTVPRETIEYLLNQARWAIRLDEAGNKLASAATAYVEELEGELVAANGIIAILRASLTAVLDKVEETPAND